MPSKYHLRNFRQGGYYHIYNRGANKLKIFQSDADYQTFLSILKYYLLSPTGKSLYLKNRTKKPTPNNCEVLNLTESSFSLMAYCLMPNHFHFLIHQKHIPTPENSITNLMRRLSIAYAMYTKDKYRRSGTLLQGRYKNVEVTSDSQLLHLSRYIHLNPTKLLTKTEKLSDYLYSSYPTYLGNLSSPWLNPQEVLSQFTHSPSRDYLEFVESQIPESTILTNLTLE